MNKTAKWIVSILLALLLGVGLYFLITSQINGQKERSYDEFIKLVEDPNGEIDDDKQIEKVVIDGYKMYGYLDKDSRGYTYSTVGQQHYAADSPLIKEWIENGIRIEFRDPNAGSVWSNVIYVGVMVLGIVGFWLILRATSGGGGKVMNFGKTKAKVSTNLKVRFSDVAGAEEEKEELAEVVEF